MFKYIHNQAALIANACLFTVLLTLASACEEGRIAAPLDMNIAEVYFPLELGHSKVYEVDSILLVSTLRGIVYDTSLLDAKEVLVDTFTAPDGRLWYLGERYEKARSAADAAYEIRSIFAVHNDGSTAIRQENNLVFTKLVSPFRQGDSWSGNGFDEDRQFAVGGEFLDIYAAWDYRYLAQATVTVNGQSYEDVIRVLQADVDNLIDYRSAYELYAPGIGLIESFIDARHTQCRVCCSGNTVNCLDLPWNEKAEKGFILKQRLIQ